jgi:hypothetical protein
MAAKLRIEQAAVLVIAALGLTANAVHAQTVITGPSISGTWSPSGNPYIIVSDCTVPSGQALVIQPGTVVWIGQGVSVTGNGMIQAVGTPTQHITFEPPVSSQTWETIVVNGTAGTNQFAYCDFRNATNALVCGGASKNEVFDCNFSNAVNALTFQDYSRNTVQSSSFVKVGFGIYMTVSGHTASATTQTTSIMNCSFTNCTSAIYGRALGTAFGYPGYVSPAKLVCTVQNCALYSVGDGCGFYIAGDLARGYGELHVINNIFHGVTNSGIALTVGNLAGASPAAVMNNAVVSAGKGLYVLDPWDATVQGCIFEECSAAVRRSGSLSTTVSFNDFFANSTNFIGYPVTYGQPILVNRNGTSSDVLFNIFQDPQFVSATDFHLQEVSPCIDAGEGSPANFDSFFPPSQGSITNDIGAYGGPNAGGWILPVSTNTFRLTAVGIPYVSVTLDPPSAGHYRLEYSSAVLGTNTWIQLTNMDLTTARFTYLEPATLPSRFYRAVKQ